jgi:O-antigen/teichoic acid export membrane protein
MREKLRSLASDTAVYGASTIIQRFLTFLLTPLYTNYLTMSELGVVSNVYALIAFVNILYAFGFESAFMRFYRGDNNEKALVFTQSFVPVVGIAACMSGILYVLRAHTAPFAGIGPDAPSSLFALVLLIPFLDAVSIIPFAQLRMERKARRFATYKVLSVVVNIALNVILVVGMSLGSRGVFIAGACSSLVSVILVAPHIARGLRRGASRLRELAAFGIPTIPSGFASMLLQVADRPILTAMTTPLIVGLYNANYRLAIPMMLCVSVFEYAWKPFYLQHAEDDDAPVLFGRIFTYFTLMSALVFLLISLFASVVVQLPFPGGTLIHPSYWQGLHIVPIVAAAYYFAGMTSNLSAGLHITKKTGRLPLVVGSAAAVNIALNVLLIPTLSYTGAAWATFGAYAVSACIMLLSSQRVFNVQYEWWRVLRIWVLSAAIFFANTRIAELMLPWAIAAKLLLVTGFVILLRLSGFFTPQENRALRSLFARTPAKS